MAAGDEYFDNLLKIVLQYTGERNTAENVLYASCLGAHGATLGNLNTLASDIASSWSTDIMPWVSAAITLANVLVSDWTDADGLTGAYAPGTEGSLSGGKLAAQTATLINEETLMRYRGGRGRIYIPQPDTTKVETDLTWTSGFVTDVTSAVQTCFDAINELELGDDLLTMVLYHRSGNKVVEQGFEEIVGVECSATPGTQRRRVRRVGHLA